MPEMPGFHTFVTLVEFLFSSSVITGIEQIALLKIAVSILVFQYWMLPDEPFASIVHREKPIVEWHNGALAVFVLDPEDIRTE